MKCINSEHIFWVPLNPTLQLYYNAIPMLIFSFCILRPFTYLKCPKCNKKAKASATKFIEYSHAQRRIRTCECGFKFITYERIEVDKQDFGQHSKEKKKEYYKKVLKELIDDLEGRTYLEKGKDSTIWEGV